LARARRWPLSAARCSCRQVPGTANFLVARTGESTFTAVTAECTHVACQVTTFDSGSGTYECPCHGSQFSTAGTVRRGPASRDLRRFDTRFDNGALTIAIV
jgi:cytochrome b6-f complex iron-sulfur subunit